MLGLGACLILRARGADAWAAFALGAALLHTVNHAVFKSLLFLGAGAFERAAGSLELDRLGGLLRRMPWTAGAFLVGAMAISGLPPLNGFASEWLTLQALLHITANGQVGDGIAGAVALAALAATAALALFCFVKVVGLVLLGPARTEQAAAAEDPPLPMRAALLLLAGACVALGLAPGLLFGPLVGLAPWPAALPTQPGLELPGTGSLPGIWIAVVLVALTGALALLRGKRSAAPAPTWASGQQLSPALLWTGAGFTKPLRLVLETVLRPQREITVRSEGGVLQAVSFSGHLPQLIEDRLYDPLTRVCSPPPRRRGGCRAAASAPMWATSPVSSSRSSPPHASGGSDECETVVAAAAQLLGGIVLAPLLPGLVQHWKARLQGRRGPTPLQPYRELRRLWGKSTVTPEGTSFLYRLAPSVVGAALIAAVLVVPAAAAAPSFGVGHDALLLLGLLALARFVVVMAAWDARSGFSLIGASRDLTLSVFVEATLVLALAVAALIAGTTDLVGVVAATAGTEVWTSPALALGALAFALVAVAEMGRQPVDSPDTHLELTMIHEGPLLEYAGRDLAYLQWAAAARHWLVLVLAAQIFLPHPREVWLQLALLPVVLVVLCAALALVETLVAKMRDPARAAVARRRRRSRRCSESSPGS